jgi:uncharacterized protein (UPF0332 family)
VSWTQLLEDKAAQKHVTSKQEVTQMRELIARDLADADVPGLSADRRFATAYNAAVQAANMAIACAGYRITAKTGHHRITLEAALLALGKRSEQLADYFETCRRKHNQIDYMRSHVATETEANEIVSKAREFFQFVEEWIRKNHPSMKR